jgi:hypothetical protein
MIQKPLPDKYIYDVQDTAGVGKFKKIDNKGRIILNYKEKDVIIIDRFSKNGFEKDQQVFFDKISNGKNLIIARELYNVFCFYDFSMNLLENYSFNESMSFLEKVVSDPSIKGDTFFKIGEFEKESNGKEAMPLVKELFERYSELNADNGKNIRINTTSGPDYNVSFEIKAYHHNKNFKRDFTLNLSFPLEGPGEEPWPNLNQHFKDVYGLTIEGLRNMELSKTTENRWNV